MADQNATRSFKSGIELEEAFIDFQQLVKSYYELSGEAVSPLIYTLDRATEKLGEALKDHQKILHACIQEE